MTTIRIDELPITDEDPNYKGWIGGIQCPSPYHDDNKPSASMNVEKGLVYCHACGTTSIVNDHYNNFIENETIRAEKEILGTYDFNNTNEPEEMPDLKYGRYWPLPEWWFERGLTREMADKFDVYCIDGINVCIPIYDMNNNYAGYVIKQHDNVPKYLYGMGSKVGNNLFGLNLQSDDKKIIIVEGILDTIWLQCHGYPAVGMFGCVLSNEQINILEKSNFSEIYLMPDNDEVGRSIGLEGMKQKLGEKFLNYYEIEYPKQYKDPQDIPGSELSNIIQYTERFNFSQKQEQNNE